MTETRQCLHPFPLFALSVLATSCSGAPQRDPRPNQAVSEPPAPLQNPSTTTLCPGKGDTGIKAVQGMLQAYSNLQSYSDSGKILRESDTSHTMEIRFRTKFENSKETSAILGFEYGFMRFGTKENRPPWSASLVLASEASSSRSLVGDRIVTKFKGPREALSTVEIFSQKAAGLVPSLLYWQELPFIENPNDWSGEGPSLINGVDTCKLVGNDDKLHLQLWVGSSDGLIRRAVFTDRSLDSSTQVDYLQLSRNQEEFQGSGPMESAPTGAFRPNYNVDGSIQNCPIQSGDWCFYHSQDACAAACPSEQCSVFLTTNPKKINCLP